MPAITKDEAITKLRDAATLILDNPAPTPMMRATDFDAAWERHKAAKGAIRSALAATEHITEAAATQAADYEVTDGFGIPPSRAEPASQRDADELDAILKVALKLATERVIAESASGEQPEDYCVGKFAGVTEMLKCTLVTLDASKIAPPAPTKCACLGEMYRNGLRIPGTTCDRCKAARKPTEACAPAGSARAGRNAQPDSADLAPTDLSAVEVPPLPEGDMGYYATSTNGGAKQWKYSANKMTNFYREGYAAGRASMKGNK